MLSMNLEFYNSPGARPPMFSVPIDIPDVRLLNVQISSKGEFIITLESTLEGTKCCCCGREITHFHGHDDWITLRHLSILGRPTYLRLRPKRYRCDHCSRRKGKKVTTTQRLSWYTFKSPHTRAYEEHVLLQLINSTVQDVSIKEGLGYDAVEGIIERNIAAQVDWEQFQRLDVLGLDEIALKKGHRDYVVIVTARLRDGQVKVLSVLPNREKKTVKKFLRSIPQRLRDTIHTVCTDMYQHYIDAVKEEWGDEVRIVVDRYHVAKKYRDCADKLRKKELKRLKKELPEEEYKQLKGVMWPFRKKEANLKPEEAALLGRLFTYSPDLKLAYTLRGELTAIFEQQLTKEEATAEIKAWRKKAEESVLTCFDTFLTTLDNHLDEITNYFVNRDTSGFVEGLNNKIKVLKRRCYGLLNVTHLFQRLYLDLEGYRLFA
jgi:transposase